MTVFCFDSLNRRGCLRAAGAAAVLAGHLPWALAATEAPNAMIERLSNEVLDAVGKDAAIKAGDVHKIVALVDRIILPHLDFKRMTAAAVGPGWRRATPEQQQRLQDEFKQLLVRTYAGALSEVSNLRIAVKPFRAAEGDKDVLVRTEVRGRGDPIELDYRLAQKAGEDWKIYNINIMGVWLVETYRSQFAAEINARGVDGLIEALVARNQANAPAR
ncbi:MlaC/ttg2D family ABC transporter substrate-binding protein [Comamonas flocculans]|uniref:ABC transporter substrate-binding protein n=1 Tax=Comamonas flocculans TaxID=2597701 RepID=A0A5B8RSL1_9BURK|nr:ABC transporter substrate-binding protein [Comamonas flocculans]QEA11828.1 ABC transporter substrate-binding protein [Comamonas flocculans]